MKIDDQHQPDAAGKYSWKQYPILVDSRGACIVPFFLVLSKILSRFLIPNKLRNLHPYVVFQTSDSDKRTSATCVPTSALFRMSLKCLWNRLNTGVHISSMSIWRLVVEAFSLLLLNFISSYLYFYIFFLQERYQWRIILSLAVRVPHLNQVRLWDETCGYV